MGDIYLGLCLRGAKTGFWERGKENEFTCELSIPRRGKIGVMPPFTPLNTPLDEGERWMLSSLLPPPSSSSSAKAGAGRASFRNHCGCPTYLRTYIMSMSSEGEILSRVPPSLQYNLDWVIQFSDSGIFIY